MARPSIAAQRRHRQGAVGGSHRIGERTARIEGCFRRITVHQLVLAWWLYRSGHMTRTQYRLYFAAHELDERRRYFEPDEDDARPLYTMAEIVRLVGGRGDPRAIRSLRADLRALARLGLVNVGKHRIRFATSADQIRLDRSRRGQGSGGGVDADPGDLSGFWTMYQEMPNRRRSVPVPRRLLRALAAGFSKTTTALVTAVLIRGLFWHKDKESGGGDYRTDGRYKLAWVAEHFGISRRAATEARGTLIELGWLEPQDVNQWEMNRWGVRDRIVTDWAPAKRWGGSIDETDGRPECIDAGETELRARPAAVGGSSAARHAQAADSGSATRRAGSDRESATPDQTESLSLSGDSKTRRLAPGRGRGEPAGVSPWAQRGSGKKKSTAGSIDRDRRGSRNPSGGGGASRRSGRDRQAESGGLPPPSIRDIRDADLRDTDRLLELHRQACAVGLAKPSESGRMDFLALAERARNRGKRPGAMFYWLIREQKTAFITLHDEDEAARRLREHLNGRPTRTPGDLDGGGGVVRPKAMPEYTDDQKIVLACIRLAKQHRGLDAFTIARSKGWDRARFEAVRAELDRIDLERWRRPDDESAPSMNFAI